MIPSAFGILISVGAVGLAILAMIFLVVPLFKGITWLVGNTFRAIGAVVVHFARFIGGMIGDTLRFVGAILTGLIFVPMILLNVLIGRWSASAHFGRALQDEITTAGRCVYRVALGHPARFLLLSALLEGVERRVPEVVAQAPGSDRPSARAGQFDGYTIVGSLQGGGSGAKLYVADPAPVKKAAFARAGLGDVGQVVIKSFSLNDGSSLPQIIRESRALEAARKLGLLLDHEMTAERFYYVTRYVPGESLTHVTRRLHAQSPDGLRDGALGDAMRYIADLLEELERYHNGGLWHKDVKPDNIIIHDGRAHVVDLGLVTPLRSAMTLTTHGTEYFRDPELVRMALRGAKVNEVDGVKFDLYGVGAVAYSVIENSFPAHGGLSQITRPCPEALRWVIRRAMTDLSKRYATAGEMLRDMRVVMTAADPFMVRPADLPSVRAGDEEADESAPQPARQAVPLAGVASPGLPADSLGALDDDRGFVFKADIGVGGRRAHAEFPPRPAAADSPAVAAPAQPAGPVSRRVPVIRITHWLTGRYSTRPQRACVKCGADLSSAKGGACPGCGTEIPDSPSSARFVEVAVTPRRHSAAPAAPARSPRAVRGPAVTARQQLDRARQRVADARARAHSRMSGAPFRGPTARAGRRAGVEHSRYSNNPNAGVLMAVGAAVTVPVLLAMGVLGFFVFSSRSANQVHSGFGGAAHGARSWAIDVDPVNGITLTGTGLDDAAAAHEAAMELHAGAPDSATASAHDLRAYLLELADSVERDLEGLAEGDRERVRRGIIDTLASFGSAPRGVGDAVGQVASRGIVGLMPAVVEAAVRQASGPRADKFRDRGASPTLEVPEAPVPPEAPSAHEVVDASGRVVVLADFASLPENEVELLREWSEGMEAFGLRVYGVTAGQDEQLLASLRLALGERLPTDRDAAERIRLWLEGHAAVCDAVLWVDRGDTAGTIERRLVATEGFDAEQVFEALRLCAPVER